MNRSAAVPGRSPYGFILHPSAFILRSLVPLPHERVVVPLVLPPAPDGRRRLALLAERVDGDDLVPPASGAGQAQNGAAQPGGAS